MRVVGAVVDSVVDNCTSPACGYVAPVGDLDYTCRMDSVPRGGLEIWRVEAYLY